MYAMEREGQRGSGEEGGEEGWGGGKRGQSTGKGQGCDEELGRVTQGGLGGGGGGGKRKGPRDRGAIQS